MRIFNLQIEMDGAAFHDPEDKSMDEYVEGLEIVRILKDVMMKINDGEMNGAILDINGNLVGEWSRKELS